MNKKLIPLAQESKKYKSAQRFLEALWKRQNIEHKNWVENITLDIFYDLYIPKDKDGYPTGKGWFYEVKRFWEEVNL